jgi:hypothetical protein
LEFTTRITPRNGRSDNFYQEEAFLSCFSNSAFTSTQSLLLRGAE